MLAISNRSRFSSSDSAAFFPFPFFGAMFAACSKNELYLFLKHLPTLPASIGCWAESAPDESERLERLGQDDPYGVDRPNKTKLPRFLVSTFTFFNNLMPPPSGVHTHRLTKLTWQLMNRVGPQRTLQGGLVKIESQDS